MANPFLGPLEGVLWPERSAPDLWMIVDGARDPRIYPSLANSALEYCCLYAGQLPPPLVRVAPYLVQLDFGSRHTLALLERAWGNSWGVFFRWHETMQRVRRHLRQFLRVRGPGGNFLVFRYYDPRVLRLYLPTCDDEELRTLFGPIRAWYMEDQDPARVLDCRRDAAGLSVRSIPLAGMAQAAD